MSPERAAEGSMTAVRKSAAVSPARRAMLAKVHLAGKELGLDDEARRDVLERVTGHRSSSACTDAQLDAVLTEFKRLGWKPKTAASNPSARTGAARAPAAHPVARKARALWISLHQLGAVRDPGERALEAFGRRQLGVDKLQWADQSQGYRLIEALKAMAERAGWSQDLALVKPERQVWSLKARLVQRQAEVLERPAIRLHTASEADLDRLAKEQGAEIRARKEPSDDVG